MPIATDILNAKILVVDDSHANLRLLENMLEMAGYRSITTVADGREVAGLYLKHRFDVILLDLRMPHMDGFQVMAALKDAAAEDFLPVLVLTAEPSYKIRALQAGARDFVSKPIDQTEVLTRIRNLLEIRLLQKGLRQYNEKLEELVREQVAQLRRSEEKLGYLSNFDVQTGLPNRILLRDRVKFAQAKALSASGVMGLLAIEMSGLPLIRTSLGIQAAHDLVAEAVRRLKDMTSADDTLARIGDGSLCIAANRLAPRDIVSVAAQVVDALERPFSCGGQELHVDPYIGMAVFPDNGEDFDFLLQAAETALRAAVAGRAERYRFYSPEFNRTANERLRLEGALRRAMEREELVLHYQPQLDLQKGQIIGLEVLIRWQHPELGLTPPGRFIGLAEETGLILPIGEWVLRHACAQNMAWQRAGLPKLPVAVNLSAKQFTHDIVRTVQAALADTGLDAKYLELELTESLSMEDPENTIGVLRDLRTMGVRLSIDDFGTGYSNLNYLKRFPVDKLKLDQSFVRELISDPDDLSIARAVIAMAHSLRLRVIAEGVETEGQLALLAQHGCDEMQGFLFSKAVDAKDCTRLLEERRALSLACLARPPAQRTVLFIDDEEAMGAAIRRVARRHGFAIRTTTKVAEAFEILATTDVSVILCDQRMSGMSGTEFLYRVKQMYPSVVRLVLSGYTDLQSVTDAVNHGAIFKFLTKPWEEEHLIAALNEAFREFDAKTGPPPGFAI